MAPQTSDKNGDRLSVVAAEIERCRTAIAKAEQELLNNRKRLAGLKRQLLALLESDKVIRIPQVQSGKQVVGGEGKVVHADRITATELRVLQVLHEGLNSNKEIAQRLGLTPRTVKFHISNLLAKFSCKRRIDLLNSEKVKVWTSP